VNPKACHKYVRTTGNHESELVKVNQVGAWRLSVYGVTYQPVENKMWHVDTIMMITCLKVKVSITPEQATKSQRGSRGIALLFL
jgi:hypothetical protein